MAVVRTVGIVFICLLYGGCRPAPVTVDAGVGTVTFEIHKANESRVITLENVAVGTTLETVMRSIDEIPIEISGSGITAFVNEIDGLKTTRTDGWTYRIDGEYVSQGIGSISLSPPTKVEWRFGSWDDLAE